MRTSLLRLAVLAGMLVAPTALAQDLPVAVAGPFTGQLAAIGEQLKRGAEMAVADINGKGGVLGRKLALTEADDQCDPRQAVAVANQLAGKKTVLVVGHACSGSSIPASDVYADEGILQITPASTDPKLTERGPTYKNVFRTVGRDDQQGAFAGEYIVQHYRGKKIAIIDDKSAYGKGLADQTKATLNKNGIQETLRDSITAGEKDFSALVSKLKSAGIEVIYFGGYHPEAGLIIRQARDQGLGAQLIGGDALNTSEFPAVAGPAGDGTLFTSVPSIESLPNAAEIAARFRQQGYNPEGYTLYTYAAFQVFADAADKAHSAKLDDLIKTMRSTTFKTVVGDLAFDEKGDVKNPKFDLYRWQGGKAELVK